MPVFEQIDENEWRPPAQPVGSLDYTPGSWSRYDNRRTLCHSDTPRGEATLPPLPPVDEISVTSVMTPPPIEIEPRPKPRFRRARGGLVLGLGVLALFGLGWAGLVHQPEQIDLVEGVDAGHGPSVAASESEPGPANKYQASAAAAVPVEPSVAPVEPVLAPTDEPESETETDSAQMQIEAAIESGAIARHRGIVYVELDKQDYRTAEQTCAELEAADEDGWRLAELSELHTLVATKQLRRRASYWSGTEDEEFGTRALAWHGRHMRASPIAKGWKGARAVCVLPNS